MPELPEVEIIAQELARNIKGTRIQSVFTSTKKLRKAYPEGIVERLTHQEIVGVDRHGKSLLLNLGDGSNLLYHLGMSGKLSFLPEARTSASRDKHEHFTLLLKNIAGELTELKYVDARRFGMVELLSSRDCLVGMDPINGTGFDFKTFKGRIEKSSTNLKSLLMRQDIVTGIGNIYASEILYDAKLSPFTLGYQLSADECLRLHTSIIRILTFAVEKGGSSIRDYVHSDGKQGSFQNYHKVYNKLSIPCECCNIGIKKENIAGRSTYFCSKCQPIKRKTKVSKSKIN